MSASQLVSSVPTCMRICLTLLAYAFRRFWTLTTGCFYWRLHQHHQGVRGRPIFPVGFSNSSISVLGCHNVWAVCLHPRNNRVHQRATSSLFTENADSTVALITLVGRVHLDWSSAYYLENPPDRYSGSGCKTSSRAVVRAGQTEFGSCIRRYGISATIQPASSAVSTS